MLIKSVNIHPLAIAGVRSIIASGVFLVLLGKPKINGSIAQIGAAISYAGTVIFLFWLQKQPQLRMQYFFNTRHPSMSLC